MTDAATVQKIRRAHPEILKAEALRPRTIDELRSCIDPGITVPFPLRPRGGNTASTDCNSSPSGLIIDMSALDRIVSVDVENSTVTAEAGVRLETLVAELDKMDLEIPGCFDLYRHTVGGAVAAPCIGPGIGEDAATLGKQIDSMRVVTPGGKLIDVRANDPKSMPLFRASYGLLGVIAEVTFRIRPKRAFNVAYRKLDHSSLLKGLDTLVGLPVGLRFFIAPHRDRAWLELMRPADEIANVSERAWRARDFGETVVLPALFRSIQRVVPMKNLKYRLIDGVSGLSKDLGQNRFLKTGSYALAASHRQHGDESSTPQYSTWCFPASKASDVVAAYIEFTKAMYRHSGYRCDLPAVGFRVARDATALLSPARAEPMLALKVSSTVADGWEDFVIDLADFGERWGGIPMFNQTRAVSTGYAQSSYGASLRAFASIRRRMDPDNRLLNPFLAQYFS
ncbi:MAG: FAD-binding oxidoreductase [Pseudomonadota bacterium]